MWLNILKHFKNFEILFDREDTIDTYKIPTMKRHITNKGNNFIKDDRIAKNDENRSALRMTHLRPWVSPRNPQKYDEIVTPRNVIPDRNPLSAVVS